MKVALYARVSTEEQKLHGLSIDAQLEALEKWAIGKQVVGRYVDAGISARKPASKRPALQRLLHDVQAGKVDLIAFTKLDRWFRNIAEYYKVEEILEKHRVAWKAIHEDYDTETASGRLKVNIMLSVAQDEADRTSERIKAVFEAKRARGEVCTGNVPLGLRIEGKRLVPTEEADLVRGVFDEYLATHSRAAAQRYLASAGYVRGYTSIAWMLKNEKYRGTVISPETFDAAQALMAQRAARSPRTDRVYIFSGLLKCPQCGGSLIAMHSSAGITYYQCNRHHAGIPCVKTCWDERRVEDRLLARLLPAVEDYNFSIKKKQKPSQAPVIRRKLERLKALYMNELIDLAEYKTEYQELQALLQEEPEQQKEIPIGEIRGILRGYDRLTPKNKSAFWHRVLRSAVITTDEDILLELNL